MFVSLNESHTQESWVTITGKISLFILLIYFSFNLLFYQRPWIFIDGINVLIHESGHLILSFGGRWLTTIGGTLMQLLIPILFFLYFLRKGAFFSSSFCLFWIGDNLINISVYIKDATTMSLELIGNGSHDWNTILGELNLLGKEQFIGGVFRSFGVLFILASLLIMGYIIFIDTSRKRKFGY